MLYTLFFVATLILFAWFGLVVGLFATTLYRDRQAADVNFGWLVAIPMTLTMIAVGAADVLFNVIFGSIIFRERPREWFFHQRVLRHALGVDARQQRKGAAWKDRINKIQPGHV